MFSTLQNRPSNLLGNSDTSAAATTSLFLQLCVNDLGICLPVIRANQQSSAVSLPMFKVKKSLTAVF